MAEVNWGIITGAPNPGESFVNAFRGGIQQRQQNALMQQQMQEHQVDRQIKMQQLQQAQAQQSIAQHRDSILLGGQIIRQVQPHDQASWDQARALAGQMGIDLSEIPAQWDDQTAQYVQGVAKLADTFGPAPAQAPSSVREYEYAKSQGFTGSYTDFQQYLHPPSALTIPNRATLTNLPGAPQQGEVTATGPNGQKIRLNPQTGQWEPMGDAGGNARGGFPSGGQ